MTSDESNDSNDSNDSNESGEPNSEAIDAVDEPAAQKSDPPFADDERTQPAVGVFPGTDAAETIADEPTAEPTVEEQLAAAQGEIKASRERMLRVAADFENYRKRTSRELDDVRRRATQEAVKVLLPVFDNLERATAHLDAATDARSMAEGIQMVHRQFIDTLAKLDIERVAAVGAAFDPTVHESIQYDHSEEHPAGTIMTELQPGYRMGGMLLRPALVVVSRGPTEEAPAEAPEALPDEPAAAADRDDSSEPT